MGRVAVRRRAVDIDRATELVRTARLSDAAHLLDEAERAGELDGESRVLRGRLYLIRDPRTALAYLTKHTKSFGSKAVRAEAAMLQGAALARLDDHASAAARFRAALQLAAGDPAQIAAVSYQQAASAWMQRKLDLATRILNRPESKPAAPPVRIQQLVLRGAIEASRGNMTEQGGLLLEALRFVRAQSAPSILHWAYVVSQVSYLARELYSPALRDAAYEELARVPWTIDLSDTHFVALRAVGWCHALDGDYFNAFRRLKDASALAPSAAWRVMALCDRAYLARCLGERRWAEQERSDARDLAATVDWKQLEGEEAFALCLLAELFADDDAPLALAHIAEYRASGKRFDRILAATDDRRVVALESYSLGMVQGALGDEAEAIRLLTQSFDIYDAVGYRWRAGRAARALGDLTDTPLWRDRAAAALAVYPRSWLAAGATSTDAVSLPGADALTASQRAVYELLVTGLSTRDIALRLQRSEFTVRNHVKAVFKALGVNSRASLVAYAMGSSSRRRPEGE